MATVIFLVVNAAVIAALATTGAPKGKSCGGFSGYSGDQTCTSDLSVTNIDAPDPSNVAGHLFYLVEVENKGPDDTFLVSISDALSPTLSIDWVLLPSDPYGYCSTQGHNLFCTFYDLAVHQKAAITIVVRPIVQGTVKNVAEASSENFDPNPGNNSRTQRTQIDP